MEEDHRLKETQKEEDHLSKEIQEEEEAGEDPRMDTPYLEKDKHHRLTMANL